MREILFRGQHIKYGQKVNMLGEKLPGVWVYGGIFPGTGDYSIIYGGKNENFTGAELDKWTVYSETVGQYTGLTDKNGKKIFEGDIVEKGGKRGYVVEHKGSWCIWDYDENDDFLSNWCSYHFEYENGKVGGCEIIGTIHDNPELLKGGNT